MYTTEITIPYNLASDFIGIIILDILHDSKGRKLNYSTLSNITNILVESIFLHNDSLDQGYLKIIIFKHALQYFCKLWKDNLEKALGITSIPDFNNTNIDYWELLYDNILTPMKNDTLLPVDQMSVESFNYFYQYMLLNGSTKLVLESPNSPNFFNSACTIINFLKNTNNKSKIVLDMKASAGLIRTVCDPIGFITGLPTFCDPGYMMPGMNAIRKHSSIDFTEFEYTVNIEYLPTKFVKLFKVEYSKGTISHVQQNSSQRNPTFCNGLELSNSSGSLKDPAFINILGHLYQGTLPSSNQMVEAMDHYLKRQDNVDNLTLQEISQMIDNNIYGSVNDNISRKKKSLLDYYNEQTKKNYKMCNLSYKNVPLINITVYLSNLLDEYKKNHTISKLLFVNCQINTLIDLYSTPNNKYKWLQEKLYNQWLPRHSGKLLTISKQLLKEYYNSQKSKLNDFLPTITDYCDDICAQITNHLQSDLPLDLHLKMDNNIEKILLTIVNPKLKLYTQNKKILAISSLMSYCAEKFSFPITFRDNMDNSQYISTILGKFSGDFGQIMWAMENKHFFASEDNNTSAMALFLQRIPNCKNFSSIHGLGDGSAVHIVSKNFKE
jgi:hypothetical protein